MPAQNSFVLDAVLGAADIGKPYRFAVLVGDDQRTKVGCASQPAVRLHSEIPGGPLKRAGRQIGVGGLHRFYDFVQSESPRRPRIWINEKAYRALLRAE